MHFLFTALHHSTVLMHKLQHAFFALLNKVNHLIYVFLHVVGTLVCLGTCPGAWKWPAFSNVCLHTVAIRFIYIQIPATWHFLYSKALSCKYSRRKQYVNPLDSFIVNSKSVSVFIGQSQSPPIFSHCLTCWLTDPWL